MAISAHVETAVKTSYGARDGVRGGDERMRAGHHSAISTAATRYLFLTITHVVETNVKYN